MKNEAQLKYWQEQVNFFENTKQSLIDRRCSVPHNVTNGLKFAKACLKEWRAA